MEELNILNPNFEFIRLNDLDTVKKYIEIWGFKKPFEFKTYIEVTETNPILTVPPLQFETIATEDLLEIINKKKENNKLYIKNLKEFTILLSEMGYIFYDEKISNSFGNIDQYICNICKEELERIIEIIYNDNKRMVEIPQLKTYSINGDAKLNFIFNRTIVGNMSELLKNLLFDYLKNNLKETSLGIEDSEGLLNEESLFPGDEFYIDTKSSLQDGSYISTKSNDKNIYLKYKSTEYKFPINENILIYEEKKIGLIKDYLINFIKILDNPEYKLEIIHKLVNSNLKYINKTIIPGEVMKDTHPIARDIKRKIIVYPE